MAEIKNNCFEQVVACREVRDDVLINKVQDHGFNTESYAQTQAEDLDGNYMYGFPIFSSDYDNSYLYDDEMEYGENNSFYLGESNHKRNPKKSWVDVPKREERRMTTAYHKKDKVRRISKKYKDEASEIKAEVDKQNKESTGSNNSYLSKYILLDEEEDSDEETKNDVERVHIMDSTESTLFSRMKCWKYYPRNNHYDSRKGDYNAGKKRIEERRLFAEIYQYRREFLGNQ